uniref:Hedgehog/Intein (Hint) domain-containing protein n=1 Tax=viral metagenome TaxID=1070528 RepID=A0A6C0EET6_9ZZZZ
MSFFSILNNSSFTNNDFIEQNLNTDFFDSIGGKIILGGNTFTITPKPIPPVPPTPPVPPSPKPPVPISDICFPAKTPIRTNQGIIAIDEINPNIHTIKNKKIEAITKTITLEKYLVCFDENSLGVNIPDQKTIISKNHLVYDKRTKKMLRANDFIQLYENVYKIPYKGEILYNVLMEEHDKLVVNNLICETLHPNNKIAKLYKKYITKSDTKIINKTIKQSK